MGYPPTHRRNGRLPRLPNSDQSPGRFFPEPDDDEARRDAYDDINLKVCEFLYRRVDIADVVDAHLLAIERAPELGFDRFIISATTPFTRDDVTELRGRAAAVVARRVPGFREVFETRGWRMLDDIDRVYDNRRARERLGWSPRYDFEQAVDDLAAGRDHRSELAREVGAKGYHEVGYSGGIFPIGS